MQTFRKLPSKTVFWGLALSGFLLLSLCSCSKEEHDPPDYCVEPTELTQQGWQLTQVIAPSSPTRIARDLLDPEANLDHYGLRMATAFRVENHSGDSLYIDSVQATIARGDGSDPFSQMYRLDTPLALADSATMEIPVEIEVRADQINLKLMQSLLEQTTSELKSTPQLFFRFSDSHPCRAAEGFATEAIATTGEYAWRATTATVGWIVENPGDFADLVTIVLSILLKCM